MSDELSNADGVDLEVIQKILENIEAKFAGKPMPWTVAALKHKAELLHTTIKKFNFIIYEKREVYEQRTSHEKVLLRLLHKCKSRVDKKML